MKLIPPSPVRWWPLPALLLILALPVACSTRPPTTPPGIGATLYLTSLLDVALAELSRTAGQLCFSPAGLAQAVGMAEAGAEGETRAQLGRLAIPQLEARADSALTLTLANALWVDERLRLAPSYTRHVARTFGAETRAIPLQRQPDASASAINAWSAEHTKGRVGQLVDAQALAGADLVLTNALYLKGLWALPFSPKDTRPSTFHGREGDRTVPMMHLSSRSLKCHFSDRGALALLPYADGQHFMALYLPPEDEPDLLPTAEQLMDIYRSATAGELVQLSLPRLRVESSLSLNGLLASLGMTLPLTPGADFSPMTGGQNGLFIQSVLQTAGVELSEEGTEASAATAIIMVRSAAQPRVFRADRPFLFFLCQADIQRVLFAGRVE